MKLLSINLARSIWLGRMSDFNPSGIRLDRILYPFLVDTYKFKFKQYPSTNEIEEPNKDAVFREGELVIDEKPIALDLTIHPDGIVVDTRSSTNHSDAFLENAFSFFSDTFKGPTFQSIYKKKLYLSQVYVSTDIVIELLNPKLKQISGYLAQHVEKNKDFQMGGISFWADQKKTGNPSPFTFERTVDTPFSENRYYSVAPLQTENHLELLDKFENILT